MKVDVEDVKKRIINGETYRSIGESYGVTKQYIAKIAKTEGIAGVGITVRQKQRAVNAGCDSYDEFVETKQKGRLQTFLGKLLKAIK